MDDLTLIGRVAPFRDASAYAASSGALNLSQGIPEPLFDNAMNAALARRVRAGWQYADPRGEMILRESIAAHSAGYAPDSEVLVTSGCTEALYLALYAASTQYGSRVAFFEPFIPITQEWPRCWGWSCCSAVVGRGVDRPRLGSARTAIARWCSHTAAQYTP